MDTDTEELIAVYAPDRTAETGEFAPDPLELARATTSLSSYCLRWKIVLEQSAGTGRDRDVRAA